MESDLKNLSSLRVNPLEEEDEEEEEEEVANDGFGKKVEQEEVDDDEEDEEEFEVTLGFVEKPKHSVVLLRHFFPSKAGGVPAWLDPVNLPSEIYFTCGFCREPLQFLLQIYAPITDNDPTFHRMLYVFMCPSTSCLLRDQHEQWKRGEDNPCRSVKIFRCQLPRSNAFYSSAAPKRNGTDKPSTFGAPLCSWCGAWKGYKICASCKSAQYCSVNHQSMHWRSGHKNECCKILNSTEVSASTTIANGIAKARAAEKYASSSLWPEFEIIIEDECAFDLENSEDNSSFNSLAIKSDKTDETYQVLSDMFEADADKKAWASFQERIAKAPRQVIRYCRDVVAKPLWPLVSGRPSKADIPRCNYCKSPLTYEFQVMPQLLFYFGENDSDSLDWGTIVAYTCSASCDAGISYKEEFAWVQLHPAST